jgi:hypothetical protein
MGGFVKAAAADSPVTGAASLLGGAAAAYLSGAGGDQANESLDRSSKRIAASKGAIDEAKSKNKALRAAKSKK